VGGLALRVRDTGPGIPEEYLDRIWEPFTQVDPSHTRESTGTGLGLAIVKRLVGFMGGEVAVSSALGHGTTFTVRIPTASP
jgi:signal transduction histidine kinase